MDVIVLDLGKIKGNCQLKGFEDKVQCNSFQLAAAMPLATNISNTERTVGKPQLSAMQMSKFTDLATPDLFQACVNGKPIDQVVLTIGRNQNDGTVMEHVKYTMKEVLVSNLITAGGGPHAMPTDAFDLSFSEIAIEYLAQKSDSTKQGTSSASWNLKTNSAQ